MKIIRKNNEDTRSGFGALGLGLILLALVVVASCDKSDAERTIKWSIQYSVDGKQYDYSAYDKGFWGFFWAAGSSVYCGLRDDDTTKAYFRFDFEDGSYTQTIPFEFEGTVYSDTSFFVQGERYTDLDSAGFDFRDEHNGFVASDLAGPCWFEITKPNDSDIALCISFELSFINYKDKDTIRVNNGVIKVYSIRDTGNSWTTSAHVRVPDSLLISKTI